MNAESVAAHTKQSTQRLVGNLVLVVVGMFGFGYLMVPIYNVLCEVTGLNGKTGVVEAREASNIEVDLTREITVEFIANLNHGAAWDFEPEVFRMQVHPGEVYTTAYVARNKTQRDVVGQAVPSVAPREASIYFNKTECFCFSQQPFAANETKNMPLTFVIDPDIPKSVKTVTLSYTFFDTTKRVDS